MHSESHCRDGITYTINVTAQNGRYLATWSCDHCGTSGTITREHSAAPAAVLSAKAHLFSEHHFKAHPENARVRKSSAGP
jgi:hypothetical protein